MRIGVPKESSPGERRVAATPKTVEQLRGLGYAVFVESGAGALASFDDEAYRGAGADIVDTAVWQCDVLLKINAPSAAELDRLSVGQTVISLLAPALNPELVEALAERHFNHSPTLLAPVIDLTTGAGLRAALPRPTATGIDDLATQLANLVVPSLDPPVLATHAQPEF